MMFYDVAVPEMGLDDLTYQCTAEIETGVRVFVEVKKNPHAGFVLGKSEIEPSLEFEIKDVEIVYDIQIVA